MDCEGGEELSTAVCIHLSETQQAPGLINKTTFVHSIVVDMYK